MTSRLKNNIFLSLMTMNPLPPQAYTKDTLTKAYLWLVHQNESIRELATTPDILCSLFLKAQRNGEDALDAPSIQNFKKELKSLAGMMGDLDSSKSPPTRPSQQNIPFATPSFQPPLPQQQVMVHATKQINIQNNQVSSQITNQLTNQVSNQVSVDMLSQLDAKSKAMISEVREQLNLSCDLEVLRLLISLGYHKAKNLYS